MNPNRNANSSPKSQNNKSKQGRAIPSYARNIACKGGSAAKWLKPPRTTERKSGERALNLRQSWNPPSLRHRIISNEAQVEE